MTLDSRHHLDMRWGRIVVGGLLIATGCKSSSNGNQTPDADVLACAAVVDCIAGDGCCPSTCTNATDADCSASCGDGTLDSNETCDPPDSCPTSCGDGDVCTKDVVAGSAANCNVACAHSAIRSAAARQAVEETRTRAAPRRTARHRKPA